MIETSKKRKRNSDEKNNLSAAVRGVIDANWQKLLSSTLLMDNKTEKPQEDKKEHYTGTFRRTRKKKDEEDLLNADNIQTSNEQDTGLRTKGNEEKKNKLTKFLAIDCEMVGIGYNGDDHMLARVSIVNKFGDCVYDKFVKAREEVKDYRTSVSGVRKEDLLTGEEFSTVQNEVSELIKGRILLENSR
ncbi:putative XPMC2 prevents mitotic catastrophe 2-like protein [Operophtera brumata]|uniref:Putative XPMC2 prevents mitotic catastrophe 2-like protein n=1 Tax=Operophtera brumata TaxID=104452 RepID=A0A0L7L7S6_OPEBR|nr:putative XPMC2 prevents mitotic catastrophe 2-like protein [Operophtera brumata]